MNKKYFILIIYMLFVRCAVDFQQNGNNLKIDQNIYDYLNSSIDTNATETNTSVQDTTTEVNQTLLLEEFTPSKEQLLFEQKYFLPWKIKKIDIEEKDFFWGFTIFTARNSYGENLVRINKDWFIATKKNCDFKNFGTVNKRAVIFNPTHLHVFPNNKKIFKTSQAIRDFGKISYLNHGQPIFIGHFSKDKQWAYVQTADAKGWVRQQDVAYIEEKIVNSWMNSRMAILIEDGCAILDTQKNFLFKTRVGMLLPIVESMEDNFILLSVRGKDKKGFGIYTVATVPKSLAIDAPLAPKRQNFAFIANKLLGKPYVWAGSEGGARDEGLFVKDFYTPFYMWIPKESTAASKIGERIAVGDLSNKQKMALIVQKAIPFKTIIYKKGHQMIYIGHKNNDPIVMHPFFAIETLRLDKIIIGKSILSTLHLRDNFANANRLKPNIITEVESFNTLPFTF